MGLFGDLLGGLEAQAGHAALYEQIGSLIAQSGGVNGLLQQFQQQGLGHLVAGNTGGATVTPISADQIIQVIGPDKVAALAAKVGLTEPQVADGISRMLPLVISHLTANGTASTGTNPLEAEAFNLLKSKLFGG